MLKSSQEKLGFREFIALACFTVGVKYVDMTTVIMYHDGLNATWMIPLFSFLFLIIPYIMLLSLLKKYNKNLVEIIYVLTGKYIGFIISLSLFIFAMTATVINSSSYTHTMHTMYLERTPMYIINGIGWIGSFYIASRGFKSLARGSYILFWYVKFFTFIFIILAYREGHIANLFPIFGPGFGEIIKTIPKNSSIYVDIFYISIFYKHFKNHNEYKKGSIIGGIIVVLELCSTFAIFAMVFYYRSLIKLQFPFQQLTMNIGMGRFISNLEIFFLAYWVITGVLRFAIYIYASAALLGYTLKTKDYKPLLLPLTTISFLLGLLPRNQVELIINLREMLIYKNMWVTITILPLTLWLISKYKGGNSGETQES